jgi:uncharacterized protein with von Willebrand factor type A (vWA) domain
VTYPFSALPENLAAFCASLRREHGFRLGPRELVDAARALEIADIANEREVRNVLRTVLSRTREDATAFDAAFDRFFLAGGIIPSLDAPGRSARESGGEPQEGARRAGAEPAPPAGGPPESGLDDPAGSVREIADLEEGPGVRLLAGYSPLEGEGAPLVLDPPARAWLEAAAALVRRVHSGPSRRWSAAARGPRFDFRRTLRASLRTGGEPVTPRWRAHPRRRPRFVLLIDGSRSMSGSAAPALQAAVALSAVSPGTETFTFSTMLRRVTREARRAAAGERRTLDVQQAWGGGTMIGACLNEFLLRFGERLLGPGSVVIIASDGLDVGSPDLLRASMARLARRAAAVAWLNPLLETSGYEPTAVGMSLARPYVTVLTAVPDPAGMRALARALKVRE